MADFDLGGLGDMLGGFQQRMAQLKAEAAAMQVTGEAGGGLVKVVATGAQEIVSVSIGEGAMGDRELLEDLVTAAANEALRQAGLRSAEKLRELAAGLPLPPGFL